MNVSRKADAASVSVMWFRRDLRLAYNEAAFKASAEARCLYVFVIDPWFFAQPEIGLLRVRFLFESLAALDGALKRHGNELLVLRGATVPALTGLLGSLRQNGYAPRLYFNRDIQVGYGRERDDAVSAYCRDNDIPLMLGHNYFLLHDKSQMDGWWKRYYEYQSAAQFATAAVPARDATLSRLTWSLPHIDPQMIAEELSLDLPSPRQAFFRGGEDQARGAIYSFLKDRVDGYHWKISRPYLAQRGATSLLGPHLAFGTVSSRAVFQAAAGYRERLERARIRKAFDVETYLDRLRWRDSFTQRLWFHPELMWQNRFREFDAVYRDEPLTGQKLAYFERWKAGTTGFPLLDAAMRQLAADGFINFRMRAMAATFLAINCGVSWHHGARWFMNTLVDGDIAINHWQWQMQSGITNPLSPTFRMYSPTKNFRDRDPRAEYVHFWLPETRGKSVDQILAEAEPMLDFNATRKANGKVIADLRKATRERIIAEKGDELINAQAAHRTVTRYVRFSNERYKRSQA